MLCFVISAWFKDGVGQPGEDCAIFKQDGSDEMQPYVWNHRDCNEPNYYVCMYRGEFSQMFVALYNS